MAVRWVRPSALSKWPLYTATPAPRVRRSGLGPPRSQRPLGGNRAGLLPRGLIRFPWARGLPL
eukprot:11201802-Lingulodinium_polyedra.AAC.1